MSEHWTIPSKEEAEAFTQAYLAAEERYYEELEAEQEAEEMRAVWGLDYDYRTDKNFRRPSCPECNAPVIKFESGEYRCVSCQRKSKVDDPKMLKWLSDREEEKVVMRDCPKYVLPDGGTVGCGGKACVETHYVRNNVTMKWQLAWSECLNCGARTIV